LSYLSMDAGVGTKTNWEDDMKDGRTGGDASSHSKQDVSRRGVVHLICAGGLAAALRAAGGGTVAGAQGTPEAGDRGPVRYALKGGDIEIVFTPAATGANATFDYRSASASIVFTGDEVRTERSTALGRFVSVNLEYAPDGYDRYLTLLVPDANPEEDGRTASVTTFAIITTHWTSIGGPALVRGALQSYEVVELDGVAEFETG
jgi:hypothetical protein